MGAIRVYPESSVAWDEAWRQRQRADKAESLLIEAIGVLKTILQHGRIDDSIQRMELVAGMITKIESNAV
jgi:hypothetical protein